MLRLCVGVDTATHGRAAALLEHDGRVVHATTFGWQTFHLGNYQYLDPATLPALRDIEADRRESWVEQPVLARNIATSQGYLALGAVLGWLHRELFATRIVRPKQWRDLVGYPWPRFPRDPKPTPKQREKAFKDASLQRARELFPSVDLRLQKHHNDAEALLIAEACRRSG